MDYTREATDWVTDFKAETGYDVDWEDPETIHGDMFAAHHDIVQYPTLLVMRDDSKVLAKWAGRLPQFEEVTYIMRDA
jgi:hypothetical protein